MLDELRKDFANYRNAGPWTHLGFWTGAAYRLGAALAEARGGRHPALRAASRGVSAPFRLLRSVDIPPQTRIGPGLCLHHPWGIVVSRDAVLGRNCTLYQGVSITEGGPVPGAPRLGDRVRVFAGARILGGVTIGDDVDIGANAVVTRDIPSDSVVSSPAARPIPRSTIARMGRNV